MKSGEAETTREAEAPLRSDAQRNKDAVLAEAVRAFAEDANAPLEGIAKAAGVGIGTLYRHYPTREALLEAAYRIEIQKLCDGAPALLAKHRPDIALARFLDRFIDHMLAKPGMIEAFRGMISAGNAKPLSQSLARVAAAVAPILEAGKAERVLRSDVSVEDFITIKGAVVSARPEKARRLATILIDGLRAGAERSGKTRVRR